MTPKRGGGDDIPAGSFAAWVVGMQAAIRGEGSSDVPCDGCTACCRSSQFIHIGPDETDTLARVPGELQFPAPGRPAGHVVLGYDDRGHCPMLVDDRCSIYEHRPVTCRTYDCRVFAAAGVELDEDDQAEIAARVRRWRFDFPTAADRDRAEAVRAAARSLREQPDRTPDGRAPVNPAHLAVQAVEIHGAFLTPDGDAAPTDG